MKKMILMAVLFCFAMAPVALAQNTTENPQVVNINSTQEKKALQEQEKQAKAAAESAKKQKDA